MLSQTKKQKKKKNTVTRVPYKTEVLHVAFSPLLLFLDSSLFFESHFDYTNLRLLIFSALLPGTACLFIFTKRDTLHCFCKI